MLKKTLGLDDSIILNSFNKSNKQMEDFIVTRAEPIKTRRYTNVHITLVGSKKEYKLIQRIYSKIDNEINRFNLIAEYITAIPNIYYLDFEQRIILMDDLDYEYFPGFNFDQNNDLEALRIGLCTEDLAIFMALHIEPNIKNAKSLLEHYYQCLCKKVKGYSYNDFINDYKISIMENMFFPIRLMKRGIYDFSMRDRAIQAFETFILN
jgi:hypothetical protein